MAHHNNAGDVHCKAKRRVNAIDPSIDESSKRRIASSFQTARLSGEGAVRRVANGVVLRRRHCCFSTCREDGG